MSKKFLRLSSKVLLLLLVFSCSQAIAQSEISDGDNDTRVDTRPGGGDPDFIDITVEGVLTHRFRGKRLEQYNNGNSLFLGFNAGLNDDGTDNRNVFIGHQSGQSNTSGFRNFGLGFQSMLSNTTGSDNIGLGAFALQDNTTGFQNSAIGFFALGNNTTGFRNIAIGLSAMLSNTTGRDNTVIGPGAGYSNTSGFGNLFMGRNTGYSVNGNNNTYLGTEAGRGSAAYSASNNVFIGYQAGYNETGSDKLYIANSNTTDPLIGGDFAAKRVGINTANPAASLDIRSDLGFAINSQTTSSDNYMTYYTSNGYVGYSGVFNGDQDMDFGTGNSNSTGKTHLVTGATPRLTVAANGNVGIGTQTPAAKLDVLNGLVKSQNTIDKAFWFNRQNSGSVGLIQSGGTATTSYIDFKVGGAPGEEGRVGVLDANSMGIEADVLDNVVLKTGGLDRLKVFPNGTVGVNAATTGSSLSVTGLTEGNNTSDRAFFFNRTNGGSVGLIQGSGTATSGYIDYSTSGAFIEGRAGALAPGKMGIEADGAAGQVVLNTNGAERLTVNADGYVGIGTTSPGVMLDVLSLSSPYAATFSSTSPAGTKLAFNTTSGFAGEIGALSTTSMGILTTGTTNKISLSTDAIERLTVTPAGKVGIGNTNPAGFFQVSNGFAAFDFGVRLGTNYFLNEGPGNSMQASGHVTSNSNGIYDLGTSTLQWRDLYLSGSVMFAPTGGGGTSARGATMPVGLAEILALEPMNYTSTDANGNTSTKYSINPASMEENISDLFAARTEAKGGDAVNTIDLIPVLVKAIQEQNEDVAKLRSELEASNDLNARMESVLERALAKIDQLEADLGACCMQAQGGGVITRASGNVISPASLEMPTLAQNSPNPFNNDTQIRYYLPEGSQGTIIIVDQLGRELSRQEAVTGVNYVTIQGGLLAQGTYRYSLIVDGVIVDSKQMLLTK